MAKPIDTKLVDKITELSKAQNLNSEDLDKLDKKVAELNTQIKTINKAATNSSSSSVSESPQQPDNSLIYIGGGIVVSLVIMSIIGFVFWAQKIKPMIEQANMPESDSKLLKDMESINKRMLELAKNQQVQKVSLEGMNAIIKTLKENKVEKNNVSTTVQTPERLSSTKSVEEAFPSNSDRVLEVAPLNRGQEKESVRLTKEPDTSKANQFHLKVNHLQAAINRMLEKKLPLSAATVTKHLIDNIQPDSLRDSARDMSLEITLYYLDGSLATMGAELFSFDLAEVSYVFPNYNSFQDPRLATWFDIAKNASTFSINQLAWVERTSSNTIHCVEKGQINVT